MQVLDAGAVGLVFVGMAGLLAWLSRAEPQPWTVVGALLLGAERRGRSCDLRFAAVLAGVVTSLGAVAALADPLRGLPPGGLAFLLVLGLPPVALAQAALADLMVRALPARWRGRSVEARRAERLAALLEGARGEVARAREAVTDPGRRAALDALTEAVSEYDAVLADDKGDTARHLRKTLDGRLRGVITLARSCLDQERREAARLLGVADTATAEQVAAVQRALLSIYEGADALAGVDPRKARELRAAWARLQAAGLREARSPAGVAEAA